MRLSLQTATGRIELVAQGLAAGNLLRQGLRIILASRVCRLRPPQQFRDLPFQLGDQRTRALVRHRAMLVGVGLELGAVDAHQAYAQQLQLLGQKKNLQEALRHRSEVLPPKARDRVVVGVTVRRDEANPDVAVRRPLDPTAGEDPVGVAVDQQRQHHPRVILRRARAAMVHLEGAQIDTLHRLDHEVPQIIRREPVPQIGRKQKRLVPITLDEVAHPAILRQIQPKVRQTASLIGIDLAKRSFQLHGARADGSVAFRRKLSREKLLYFLAALPRCVVAMEACASAHHWGREIMQLGHDVRLVPPIYVKPFVKRQKNDAADAEAICEAAQRPTMRFVAVKGEEQQARAMLFHTRDLLVRQRTQTINALRGHLAEFGVVAPQGVAHVGRLALALEDSGSGLPGAVRALGGVLLGQIADLDAKIGGLEKELRACARQDEQVARLMTIPGIGPISAMALQAFAPPMESFRRGRDFSAWLGLVPRQHTTGGKPRLGRISKMGQRDLRRLLIIGAMAVVSSAVRRGETNDPWLARMLARKPRMLVAVALANRMARIVWALMTKKENYRAPAAA